MDEQKLEHITKELFDKAGNEEPSVNFSDNVMSRITPSIAPKTYEPLIGIRGWGLIAAGIAAIVSIAFFVSGGAPVTDSAASPYLDKFVSGISRSFGELSSFFVDWDLLSMTAITAVLVLAFLGFDYLLKGRTRPGFTLI